MQSFTQEDLVQYLYQETSTEKTAAIKAALKTDWDLREEFEKINSGKKQLEKINLSPRKKTIDNILNYAGKVVEELSTPV